MVAISTNDFICSPRKKIVTIVPKTTKSIKGKLFLRGVLSLMLKINEKHFDKTFGKASKQVRVVLNIVEKAVKSINCLAHKPNEAYN